MNNLRTEVATLDTAEEFLRHPIRQTDIDEWVLGSGRLVAPTLRAAVKESPYVKAMVREHDGRVLCIWGITLTETGEAIVWLIAAQEAEKHGLAIHRFWREEVAAMHERWPTLFAFPYANNSLHLHWLDVVGFSLIRPVESPSGAPFLFMKRLKEASPCAIQ